MAWLILLGWLFGERFFFSSLINGLLLMDQIVGASQTSRGEIF